MRRSGWLATTLAGAGGACLAAGAVLLAQPARVDVPAAGELPQVTVPAAVPPSGTPGDRAEAAGGVRDLPAGRRPPATAGREQPAPLPALVLPPATLRVPGTAAARVVPVGTEPSGALELPDGTSTVGWWVGGALPGAARGTVVLA